MQTISSERYLTYEQAAGLLCMSTGGLRNRLCRGEPVPPSVKIGRRRLFPESELHRWLAQQGGLIAQAGAINGN